MPVCFVAALRWLGNEEAEATSEPSANGTRVTPGAGRRIRVRLAFGLGLTAAAGVVFGHAWTAESTGWWWVGALTALSGLLVILSGLALRSRPPEEAPPRLPKPHLGDLLVRRGWITDGQLANALARQNYTKRPLGQILMEMGAISPSQLSEALKEQGLEPSPAPSPSQEPGEPEP